VLGLKQKKKKEGRLVYRAQRDNGPARAAARERRPAWVVGSARLMARRPAWPGGLGAKGAGSGSWLAEPEAARLLSSLSLSWSWDIGVLLPLASGARASAVRWDRHCTRIQCGNEGGVARQGSSSSGGDGLLPWRRWQRRLEQRPPAVAATTGRSRGQMAARLGREDNGAWKRRSLAAARLGSA